MNKHIILLCGKKQTGKSSLAKFLCGLTLYNHNIISEFSQNSDGDLLVPTDNGWGILDLYRKDTEFLIWSSNYLWPKIRIFSLADELKQAIHHIFNIDLKLLYGSDKDKNTKTNIKYKNVSSFIPKEYKEEYKSLKPNSYITIRQLLVIFGTYICRKIENQCWINKIYQNIIDCESELCIIDDCRLENEYQYFANIENTIPILCKNNLDPDNNPSETFLFPEEKFELILDTSENSLIEKNEKVKNYLLNKSLLTINLI